MSARKTINALVCIGTTLLVSGCYYLQAANGQLEVMRKREPIDEVIADPSTPSEIARRLELIKAARQFSIDELGLPDNDSYRSYADLERDYVVWNIFAAEEFSLEPKRWCYPIVGCVAYRGYFNEDVARDKALKLEDNGYDVFVGGVAAYSTLGRFDDPVLNTMLSWDDARLVGVLFHELAHQVLYIKNDTAFNESFATAVEEAGLERFLEVRGMQDSYERYRATRQLRRDMMRLINAARDDLRTYYSETIDADEKRLLKEHRIERLTSDLRRLLVAAGEDPERWLWAPFNNARLASFALYEGHLPAFRRMLADCDRDFACFYAEAERVSKLKQAARVDYLEALATR